MKKKGFFIVFEGGEGVGKTTQIELLKKKLETLNLHFVVTREPGGTEVGEKIRRIILENQVCEKAELLLYLAGRAEHVEKKILPALKNRQIVICDRFQDSSVVYQGICRRIGISTVKSLNQFATSGLKADRTFLLDLKEAEGLKRIHGRKKLDRIERESQEFHSKVRKGFLKLSKQTPKYTVLPAHEEPEHIAEQIWKVIEKDLWH